MIVSLSNSVKFFQYKTPYQSLEINPFLEPYNQKVNSYRLL
jgi:hypothetical protein